MRNINGSKNIIRFKVDASKNKFDILIIGSGIGALACASVFAQKYHRKAVNKTQRICTAWLLILLFPFLTLFVFAQENILIPFELKDQFDHPHADKEFSSHIVILIGSDKGGSQYNRFWGKAIHDSLKQENGFKHIKFLAVADLRGVPFFLKGFVKGKFSKDGENWVLMDWKGTFATSYQFEADASNIIIFKRDGKLVYKTAVHDLEQETLGELLTILRQLMRGE